jgi:hypothetical protein
MSDFYKLKTIPLLPKLKDRSTEEWKALAEKYPLGERGTTKGMKPIHSLMKQLRELELMSPTSIELVRSNSKMRSTSPLPPLPVEKPRWNASPRIDKPRPVTSPKRIRQRPVTKVSSGKHMTVLLPLESGEYSFWDPHQRSLESEASVMNRYKEHIEQLAGDTSKLVAFSEDECPPLSVQGKRPACTMWSEIRALHPEKTNKQFLEMVQRAEQNPKYKEAFLDVPPIEVRDLIPIAIFEQLKEEGRPKVKLEEREEYRKGLGRKRK